MCWQVCNVCGVRVDWVREYRLFSVSWCLVGRREARRTWACLVREGSETAEGSNAWCGRTVDGGKHGWTVRYECVGMKEGMITDGTLITYAVGGDVVAV